MRRYRVYQGESQNGKPGQFWPEYRVFIFPWFIWEPITHYNEHGQEQALRFDTVEDAKAAIEEYATRTPGKIVYEVTYD